MSYTGDASTLALERHGKLARGFQWRGSFSPAVIDQKYSELFTFMIKA